MYSLFHCKKALLQRLRRKYKGKLDINLLFLAPANTDVLDKRTNISVITSKVN